MNDPVTLALLTPIPFAIVEWFIIASYLLYWSLRPPSIWRRGAALIFCACPLGFLFVELNIAPEVLGFDKFAGYVFYSEAFGTLLVSAGLAFTLLYKQAKAQSPSVVAPGSPMDGVPVTQLPKMLLKGLAALACALALLTLLPRAFVQENAFWVSLAFGPVLGVLLTVFGVPILRGKTDNRK
jgi:hypothetical protein